MEEMILKNFIADIEDSDDIEIAQWYIKEGESFQAGQQVLEALIGKTVIEVTFEKAGRLVKILVEDGEIVNGEQTIAQVEFN